MVAAERRRQAETGVRRPEGSSPRERIVREREDAVSALSPRSFKTGDGCGIFPDSTAETDKRVVEAVHVVLRRSSRGQRVLGQPDPVRSTELDRLRLLSCFEVLWENIC